MRIAKRRKVARHIRLMRRELRFHTINGKPRLEKLWRGPISAKDWTDPDWQRYVLVDPVIRKRQPLWKAHMDPSLLPPLYRGWGVNSLKGERRVFLHHAEVDRMRTDMAKVGETLAAAIRATRGFAQEQSKRGQP